MVNIVQVIEGVCVVLIVVGAGFKGICRRLRDSGFHRDVLLENRVEGSRLMPVFLAPLYLPSLEAL